MTQNQAYSTLDAYYRSIRRCSAGNKEEQLELARRCRDGDMYARNRMAENNLKLVIFVAKRFGGSSLSAEDLIQAGNLGLLYAVDHFDPEYGNSFSTFAVPCIHGSISRALSNAGMQETVEFPEDEELMGTAPDPEELVEQAELRSILEELLSTLGAIERTIVLLMYGLEDGICRGVSETANICRLDTDKVRRLHRRALCQMRCSPYVNLLRAYA